MTVDIIATGEETYRAFFLGAYVIPYKERDLPVGQMKLLGDDYQVREDCYAEDGTPALPKSSVSSRIQGESACRFGSVLGSDEVMGGKGN